MGTTQAQARGIPGLPAGREQHVRHRGLERRERTTTYYDEQLVLRHPSFRKQLIVNILGQNLLQM
jgi:hypothetical protein